MVRVSGFSRVDVFAAAHRVNVDQRVPVVRRAVDHHVDALMRDRLAEVGVPGFGLELFGGLLDMLLIDVAHRD